MLEHVLQFLLTKPQRIIQLGAAVTYFGTTALLAGAISRVFLVASGFVTPSIASPESSSLALLFPSLPTWWIPESSWVAGFYVVLAFFGAFLNAEGRRFQRLINRF